MPAPVPRREKRCWSSLSWLGWPWVVEGCSEGDALLLPLPIPKPGTETPAWPRRLIALWFKEGEGLGASGRVASPYVGGGGGVNSSGYSFWRGGRTGGGLPAVGRVGGGAAVTGEGACARPGRAGGGRPLAGGAGPGLDVPVPVLRTGGGGRLSVRNPEVSLRYGPGGGLGSSSSASCGCVLYLGAGTGPPNDPPPPPTLPPPTLPPLEDGPAVIARFGEAAPGP